MKRDGSGEASRETCVGAMMTGEVVLCLVSVG